MFKDQMTGKTSKPGEKAIKVVTKTRNKIYTDENEVILGRGVEIVKEIMVTAETAKMMEAGLFKRAKASS